jgi:hypothetical protein
MRVRNGPLDMATYLLIWVLVVIHEQANLRTRNPQVVTIAVWEWAEAGTIGVLTLLRTMKQATHLQFRSWAPGDSNPEPAD